MPREKKSVKTRSKQHTRNSQIQRSGRRNRCWGRAGMNITRDKMGRARQKMPDRQADRPLKVAAAVNKKRKISLTMGNTAEEYRDMQIQT